MDISVDRYCYDLPTSPVTENKILVTGATGYIGGELVPELVARGYKVKVMVRTASPVHKKRWPSVEIVVADVLDYNKTNYALKGIDCAYYLIHSLHLADNFVEVDSIAAINFQRAAEANHVKRIIYLGSLGKPDIELSDHLSSRLKVAEDLRKGKVPVTFLKAAIIIGSGSASYRIINQLIQRCPIFVFPSWAKSRCQPIAIRDVIKYLVACLEKGETTGKTYDIGGPNILTYRQMLRIQAMVLGKRRLFINSSISKLDLYIKITNWLTPLSQELIRALMASCMHDVICQNADITKLIPFETIQYPEALERALSRESQKIIFEKKEALAIETENGQTDSVILKPPEKSKGILSDIRCFLFHKPNIPTLIEFNSKAEREDYQYRIIQRLGVEVARYKILNVHKIGVQAPSKHIFEELLEWNGDSSCWPNHIAKVVNRNNRLETLYIFLFGWAKFPKWLQNSFLVRKFAPLFALNAIKIRKIPDPTTSDNARYLLYKSSGGYPIGVFTIYVRSSIASQEETEQSQLFLMVGFNFYGREKWSKWNLINRIWESIHNRVTANVLNRLKQLSEWRFEKMKTGLISQDQSFAKVESESNAE